MVQMKKQGDSSHVVTSLCLYTRYTFNLKHYILVYDGVLGAEAGGNILMGISKIQNFQD